MEKTSRPKVVAGINERAVTGCGNMYVQMGWWNGQLLEVFATLGRAGGCATCFNESLTRTITTGLRCGVPVTEYVRQLKGVRCPSPVPFPKEDAVLSCPDALARILEKYASLTVDEVAGLLQGLLQASQPAEEDSAEAGEAAKHIEQLKAERDRQGLR